MESITDDLMELSIEEEDMDMYSSPYENYHRVVQTIQTLESGARLTEDWYEEHKKHILKYRDVFPNFRNINEDIEDIEFRKKADETETILSNLVHEVNTFKTFNLKIYLLLNKRLKDLCELIWGEQELLDMLSQMRM